MSSGHLRIRTRRINGSKGARDLWKEFGRRKHVKKERSGMISRRLLKFANHCTKIVLEVACHTCKDTLSVPSPLETTEPQLHGS